MPEAKNKGGRPPLTPGQPKGHMLQVRLSDAELAEYQKAAERAGKPLSAWIRDLLSKAAKRAARQN